MEAVEIIYDTREISYSELLTIYWQITDPTDTFGQFQDRGKQYRPVIFYQDERQKRISGTIKTETRQFRNFPPTNRHKIEPAGTFWPAENYHQQFYKNNRNVIKKSSKHVINFLIYQRVKTNGKKIYEKIILINSFSLKCSKLKNRKTRKRFKKI